jgi:hypothetical protein
MFGLLGAPAEDGHGPGTARSAERRAGAWGEMEESVAPYVAAVSVTAESGSQSHRPDAGGLAALDQADLELRAEGDDPRRGPEVRLAGGAFQGAVRAY